MTVEELAKLRAFCLQADEARADLDNDYPVGAVARGKWQEARRAMGEACPSLLEHIRALSDALTQFAYRDDSGPILLRERSNARELLESGVYRPHVIAARAGSTERDQ